jgi:hypothetical protein
MTTSTGQGQFAPATPEVAADPPLASATVRGLWYLRGLLSITLILVSLGTGALIVAAPPAAVLGSFGLAVGAGLLALDTAWRR